MKQMHWITGMAGIALAMSMGTANAALSNSDVTFNNVAANGNFLATSGNKPSDQGTSTITSFANSSPTGWGLGNGWTFLVRDNSSGTGSTTYNGFNFTLAAANGSNGQSTPAAWTLTVTDTTPNSGLSIPFMMDFLVHMHAGNKEEAFYFFDDRTIEASNAGTFKIAFTNNGGNFAGLSNFDLLVRDFREITTEPPSEVVPEPVSLLLFGAGLLGLSLSRRFKLA